MLTHSLYVLDLQAMWTWYYSIFHSVVKLSTVELNLVTCVYFTILLYTLSLAHHTHTHNSFTALFPGPLRWAGARKELLYFMVQGKINRVRHTDHPDGRHSIRTSNQCPRPPFPIFFTGQMPFLPPTNSVKAPKAASAFGLGRRR